ncbi:DUF7619 domain-containing protein [Flavobacterium humi]|uniref:T9SS type A sorting domain-containing protein n=1 Tax=Flavobacterium humi TaxID=2562683 RepID=A0A4Z0L9S8_9FLAO|nr:T9SS type A sorting domain-containing protein [Flavobacterium humi]TGD59059.1 T9SS type A sorting domain-containing protein [Flavobacterium humi]
MRKLYAVLLLLFVFTVSNAQIVNFTDINLKTILLTSTPSNTIAKNLIGQYFRIDSNYNGEIEASEAQSVSYIDVNNQSITSLTGIEAFTNLAELNCEHNSLTVLDATPFTSIKRLICSYNQMTSLNISGMPNLQYIQCFINQLTELNLSNLPNLTSISCGQNMITNLDVSGLSNLQILFCSENQLTTLDVSNLTKLITLQCMDNQITSLTTNNLPLLEDVICYNNQITSIDLTTCPIAAYLDCHNNQIEMLLIKNGKNTSTQFGNNPNIHYICADNYEISAIQSGINSNGYASSCIVNTYCSFTPGGIHYIVKGNTKLDTGGNGCDASDQNYPNLKINYTNGSITGSIIPDNSGNYFIPFTSGSQTLTPVLENPTTFSVSPTVVYVNFPSTPSPYIKDFCVTYNGIPYDLEVKIIPLVPARPGFNAIYKIIYRNKGALAQSGNINLTFNDAVLDFISSQPNVTGQTTDNLSWSFSNLQPYEAREIIITLNANSPTETPPLNSGDILPYIATITSAATDGLPADNNFRLNQTVVNSLDPNDKKCLEGNIIGIAKVGDFVHYMIRFENTGTFPAQNIVVKDIIDTSKFDISTLMPVNGSHPFVTKTTNPNTVEFIFEDINLPFTDDSNDGYVVFKIKTKSTLTLGTTFSNTATIYFDYNFPITTNTATTTVVSNILGTQDFEFKKFIHLYPNPVKNILNIDNKHNIIITSLSVYNNLGQLVQTVTNPSETIDVSGLKTGNYILKIISDKGTSSDTFIKE